MKVECRLFVNEVYEPEGENETLINFLQRLEDKYFISAEAVSAKTI